MGGMISTSLGFSKTPVLHSFRMAWGTVNIRKKHPDAFLDLLFQADGCVNVLHHICDLLGKLWSEPIVEHDSDAELSL